MNVPNHIWQPLLWEHSGDLECTENKRFLSETSIQCERVCMVLHSYTKFEKASTLFLVASIEMGSFQRWFTLVDIMHIIHAVDMYCLECGHWHLNNVPKHSFFIQFHFKLGTNLWKVVMLCPLFCFMAVCIEFIKCSNHGVNNIKVTFGSQKNIFSKVMKAFTVTKEYI